MSAALDFEKGEVLLVDKPLNWTSFDVVHRVRDLFHVKKVGHAGTLDPKATGLLILCTGKKTKEIDTFTGQEKEYEGIMQLGATTVSFDSETPEQDQKGFLHIDEEANPKCFFHLCRCAPAGPADVFRGEIRRKAAVQICAKGTLAGTPATGDHCFGIHNDKDGSSASLFPRRMFKGNIHSFYRG